MRFLPCNQLILTCCIQVVVSTGKKGKERKQLPISSAPQHRFSVRMPLVCQQLPYRRVAESCPCLSHLNPRPFHSSVSVGTQADTYREKSKKYRIHRHKRGVRSLPDRQVVRPHRDEPVFRTWRSPDTRGTCVPVSGLGDCPRYYYYYYSSFVHSA